MGELTWCPLVNIGTFGELFLDVNYIMGVSL